MKKIRKNLGCFEPFHAILGDDNLKLDEVNFDIFAILGKNTPGNDPSDPC